MPTLYLELILLPFLGFFIGILSMLYGIGGGVIITPVVYLFLCNLGFEPGISMHISIGTSMLSVLGSTISASYSHHKQGNIFWAVIRSLAPFILIGSLLGVILAHLLSGLVLKKIFIGYLIFILFHSFFNKNFRYPWTMKDYLPPKRLSSICSGIIIGTLSVLVGIGGGTLIVPYLRHYRMPMLNATAVATTITPLMATIGSIGYLSIPLANVPSYTVGTVNLPIFACIFLGSWLGVQFGKTISPHFNETWRARSFPILIAGIIALMLFG